MLDRGKQHVYKFLNYKIYIVCEDVDRFLEIATVCNGGYFQKMSRSIFVQQKSTNNFSFPLISFTFSTFFLRWIYIISMKNRLISTFRLLIITSTKIKQTSFIINNIEFQYSASDREILSVIAFEDSSFEILTNVWNRKYNFHIFHHLSLTIFYNVFIIHN